MKPQTVRKLMHDIDERKRKYQKDIEEANRGKPQEIYIRDCATRIETYEEIERLIMKYRNGEHIEEI